MTNPAPNRDWMVADLVNILANLNDTHFRASDCDDEDELRGRAEEYLSRDPDGAGDDLATDEEIFEAADRYAKNEIASWRAAQ